MPHRDHPVTDWSSVVVDDAQLIDVRQPEEVAGGTLDGAVNIPLDDLPGRAGELDPTRRVVLLCRSGGRSAMAAEFLTASGFTDVINLAGGMLGVTAADG
jgi:rhodanese-related sulfurtransferase